MPSKLEKPQTVENNWQRMESQDETSQLWAVSYADLLMVLLCFFILFFSYGTKEKNSILQSIRVGNQTGTGSSGGEGDFSGAETGTDTPSARVPAALKSLESLFEGTELTKKWEDERLLLLLPDNLFRVGSVSLEGRKQALVKNILVKLKPYADQIEITFIGHADGLPLRSKNLVQDNFDLSSFRGTRALQYAVHLGFSPRWLSAMGTGEHGRKKRTLSLLIRARTDGN